MNYSDEEQEWIGGVGLVAEFEPLSFYTQYVLSCPINLRDSQLYAYHVGRLFNQIHNDAISASPQISEAGCLALAAVADSIADSAKEHQSASIVRVLTSTKDIAPLVEVGKSLAHCPDEFKKTQHFAFCLGQFVERFGDAVNNNNALHKYLKKELGTDFSKILNAIETVTDINACDMEEQQTEGQSPGM